MTAQRKDSRATDNSRLPPHSTPAEEGVLGCILLNPTECMMQCIAQFPGSEVFYNATLRTVYDLLLVMHEDREAIDLITVRQKLKDKNQLESIGGLEYLTSLPDSVPNAGEIARYIPIVIEKFKRRKFIQGCTAIIGKAYDESQGAEGDIEEMQRDLLQTARMGSKKGDWSVKAPLAKAISEIRFDVKSGGVMTGLPTGFEDLDALTRGLQPGDFIVIAARPSMGKSTLVMNFVDHLAAGSGIPCGVLSLEMSPESLMKRMISARSRVNLRKLAGDLWAEQLLSKEIAEAVTRLEQAPIYIDDARGKDDVHIRTTFRQMVHEKGIKLGIVDYLQLIKCRQRMDNRAQQVAHISNAMKGIAGELNIPIVVCAQLNREAAKREGERPRISDLKESGDIEQDADLIGLLYATTEDDEGASDVPSALYIGKQRNGPTGVVHLMFRKDIFRFVPAQKIREEDVPK